MKIIFQIGTNKTGSTSIQKSFLHSQDLLQKQSILYPTLTNHPHHKVLLYADGDADTIMRLTGAQSLEKVKEITARSEQVWHDLTRQIQSSQCEVVVLSSEYAFGLPKEHWERLIRRMRTLADEVSVVGYLRSPASHYLSATQQLVKYGYKLKDPYTSPRYRRLYQKISKLDLDSATILPFERSAFHQQCVFQDFLTRILKLSAELTAQIPTQTSNESLSAEGMKLMRDFNFLHFPERRIPGNNTGKYLISVINRAEASGTFTKPRLHPDVIHRIMGTYAKDLVWLKKYAEINFRDVDYDQANTEVPPPSDFGGPLIPLSDLITVDTGLLAKLRTEVTDILLDDFLAAQPVDKPIVGLPARRKSPFIAAYLSRQGFDSDTASGPKSKVLAKHLAKIETIIETGDRSDGLVYGHLFQTLTTAIRRAAAARDKALAT